MKTKLIDVVDPELVALHFKSAQGQQVIQQCAKRKHKSKSIYQWLKNKIFG